MLCMETSEDRYVGGRDLGEEMEDGDVGNGGAES